MPWHAPSLLRLRSVSTLSYLSQVTLLPPSHQWPRAVARTMFASSDAMIFGVLYIVDVFSSEFFVVERLIAPFARCYPMLHPSFHVRSFLPQEFRFDVVETKPHPIWKWASLRRVPGPPILYMT